MKIKLKFACTAFLIVLPTFANGQMLPDEQVVNQEVLRCSDREIRIWGETEDTQLLRGEEKRIQIGAEGEVSIFCGREPDRFFCPQTREVRFVNVKWSLDGTLFLQCLLRE